MSKWKTIPLSEIAPATSNVLPDDNIEVWNLSLNEAESVTGRVLKKSFCRVRDLGSAKCSFDERHVLYSKLRPYLNKVVLPDEPGVGTSELIPMLPKPDRLDREFLAYYLRSPIFLEFANVNTRGANLPRIAMKELWKHEIPLPETIDEQCRIVARIKECMERVEEIENIRKEATHDLESLIPAALEDIFHKNGFDEVPLFDLMREKPKNGVYLPKDDYVKSGGVPIVRMGEMFRRFEVKEQVERSVNATKKLVDDYGLLEGDVLVARRSIVYEGSGSMAMVTKPNEGSIFESSIIRLRFDINRILPSFVVTFFHSREGFYRRMSITKKATISGVNQQGLQRLIVPCPSIQNQEDALQRVDHVRASCSEMERLIPRTEVSALRESILRKAFTGEL